MTHKELINYFYAYCELVVWYCKINLQSRPNNQFLEDINSRIDSERRRIIASMPDLTVDVVQELDKVAQQFASRANYVHLFSCNINMV
jgi:hypothetical protein